MMRQKAAPAGLFLTLFLLAWFGMSLAVERASAATGSGTLVKFDSATGPIYVDLFNALTPVTTQNFLSYVNSNKYQDTIIHRDAWNTDANLNPTTPFVIQGGAFTSQFGVIPASAAIQNEAFRSNTVGTIAMGLTGQSVAGSFLYHLNSATNQWFFNLNDNTDLDSVQNLDGVNGGLAVFGQIVGNGMNVANQIANSTFADFSGTQPGAPTFNGIPSAVVTALGELPVKSSYTEAEYNSGTTPAPSDLFSMNITVVGTHPAWQNPMGLVSGSEKFRYDVNNDGSITSLDVLTVVNFLNGHTIAQDDLSQFVFQAGLTGSASAGDAYLDVNGSGVVESLDVLQIVNYLNSQPTNQAAALPAPQSLAMIAVTTPEPGTLCLIVLGALPLAGLARRRRFRRR